MKKFEFSYGHKTAKTVYLIVILKIFFCMKFVSGLSTFKYLIVLFINMGKNVLYCTDWEIKSTGWEVAVKVNIDFGCNDITFSNSTVLVCVRLKVIHLGIFTGKERQKISNNI